MNDNAEIVVITGGTRGIGRAIAEQFCHPSAHLILTYLQDSDSAATAVEQLRPKCASVAARQVNMNDPEDIGTFADFVSSHYPHVSRLINNAAAGVFRDLENLKLKHWDYTYDVCVRSIWHLSVLLKPQLRKAPGGATIIHISSLGSQRYLANYAAIGTAKAALESLGRYMAMEFAGDNINVNTVSSTTIATHALDRYPTQQKLYEATLERTPAGRLVSTDDIAGVVHFLCSPRAAMIRGQVIVVDGGFSLT
ncbi:SDR family oxidoreductase [Cohnella lubricantis]|uniref:SDR family oxidoreductase n=1 Tax=Cohnella lubricantis TaxID=2163172 RepID=A0A841TEP9_9BACL|nr:SDR family oxidoreductase [Cohnella lubricantis]MBB6677457.1 SDR family oxidoreductase [Cohnella lubricantis]MBP2116657.1 enoyl-[acyl-carrier protein] reductase III [Cohnella lubricantis]